MTLAFADLLARMDDEALAAFVGPAGARLLAALTPAGALRPSALREIALGLHGPHGLLADADHRTRLLGGLRETEATALLRALGEPDATDPHAAVAGLRPRRGSGQDAALYAFFGLRPPVAPVHVPAPATATVAAGYGLFAHQRRALREAADALAAPPHRVMLHMPTGSGKTRTAMALVARHLRERDRGLVVWLVYGEELCEQAAAEFERAWAALGDRDVAVYRFWGDRPLHLPDAPDGIVVASLPKLYAAAMERLSALADVARAATLVVVDEAHQAVAETYELVIAPLVSDTPATGLLGLTATPGRATDDAHADARLARFFGDRKVTLRIDGHASPVDALVADGFLSRARFEPLHHAGALDLTSAEVARLAGHFDVPPAVLRRLADDEVRNAAIVHRLDGLMRRHERLLVFATTVGHADLLATVLRARGADAFSVSAATPPAVRRERLDRFLSADAGRPVVLCNYGILTTGFDAPRTSAALVARPTKSLVLYSQMVGRALRGPRAGGTAEAEIVTVLDPSLPGFGSVADAFAHWNAAWN